MGSKGNGLNAAKKAKARRSQFRWADDKYKNKTLGLKKKSDPLGGSYQAKAIVLKKVEREAKQPNSGLRKCVVCQLSKNGKKITVFAPRNEAIKFINEHDEVVIECIGGAKGRSKGDIPGVRWQVIKVNDQSLNALVRKKIEKGRR